MTRLCRGAVLGLVAGMLTVHAQSSPDTLHQHSAAATDSTRPATQTPYRSNCTIAEHVLALPAYVLHGITRPIG